MTPEEYARIRVLFDEAMDLPTADRRTFIDQRTAVDDPLRAELLAMIDAGDDSAFLAKAALAGVVESRSSAGVLPVQIDNYKILRELGRGGMGVVYLALRNDDVFHKVVALKVIGGGDGDIPPSYIQRFKQERQILAGLDHPNVARILDGGNTDDGRPFYVMEYVAGSPIDEYCNRVKADVPARVRMIIEVCQAVEYLHAHAITHRDIKPNNILVTSEGRVKLVDFGIAKIDTVDGMVNGASTPGQATMIMTPGYASPEQIAGTPAGKSGDIYSLAVVLYRLLTGRLPYADQEGRPNLLAQLSGPDPEPPSKDLTSDGRPPARTETRRATHPDLDRVVLMGLQRDPLKRYTSVQVFSEDLRRFLDGRPIAARSGSWTYNLGKHIARNKMAAVLAGLVVIAAIVVGWLVIRVNLERTALQTKETEVARFIEMLNAKVQRWNEPEQAVPTAEKVADVQAAGQLMASDTMQTLSARAADPDRVKRLVSDLRSILDRADELSVDQPLLRKEISLAYRKIGDFEANAPRPQVADKKEAAASYRRAANVAASVRAADASWADRQLTELDGQLRTIGSPLNFTPGAPPAPSAEPAATTEPAPPAEVEAPSPSPTPTPTPASPPVKTAVTRRAAPEPAAAGAPAAAPAAPVDAAAREELLQRLRLTTATATRTRKNLESLRDSLAARGQTIRPELLTSMDRVDALIQEAGTAAGGNDLDGAEDSLRRAAYELKKIAQAVGG